ncbi:hypothetical protein SERLA73DRAFT_137895, partial [Serpula lacrymans var. lacrymans S7.3]
MVVVRLKAVDIPAAGRLRYGWFSEKDRYELLTVQGKPEGLDIRLDPVLVPDCANC